MQCNQAKNLIDVLMDGELIGELKSALEHHAESCADCRMLIKREYALRDALSALPVEEPRAGFHAQALLKAHQADADESRPESNGSRTNRPVWFGGALAAGVTVWFAASFLFTAFTAATDTPDSALPVVAIAMEQPTPVNLVFTSTGDLEGARVSLQLPPGVSLVGYDGRRALTWTTDLHDGKNVLKLPLVAHAVPAEEIIARLEHGNETKTFRLKVRIKPASQGTVL